VIWAIVHQKHCFGCFEPFRILPLVQIGDNETIDLSEEKSTVHARIRSLPQDGINVHTIAMMHQPLVKRPGVVWYDDVRRKGLPNSQDTRDYPHVLHTSRDTMIRRFPRYCLRDNHFLRLPILLFWYTHFVEMKHQFHLHPMDTLSQSAYRFIQESPWPSVSCLLEVCCWSLIYFHGDAKWRSPCIIGWSNKIIWSRNNAEGLSVWLIQDFRCWVFVEGDVTIANF
jgi:hypothetical protein